MEGERPRSSFTSGFAAARFSTGELLKWRAQLFCPVKTRQREKQRARFPDIASRFIVLSPCLGKEIKLTRHYRDLTGRRRVDVNCKWIIHDEKTFIILRYFVFLEL